ncbi:histidine kinase [Actinomycetes bacterium KLBMP 9759]
MQAQRSEDTAAPGLGRLGRLAPAFVLLVLIGRLTDAVTHPDLGYTPFVAAVFLLPLWYATGIGRAPWRRWYPALLGLQLVLSFAPFALFGGDWPGGVVGPLGGLLLLTLRAPLGWMLFLATGVADLAVRIAVGLPPVPPHAAAPWVVITYLDTALALYGLVRLTDMATALHATRSELADSAVTHQRLTGARRLRAAVVDRLDQVVGHAATALRGIATAPDRTRRELDHSGRLAREAAAEIRRTVPAGPLAPGGDPAAADTEVLAPRLARSVLLAMLVMFGVITVLNVVRPSTAVPFSPLPVVLAAVVSSAAIVLLQWRHSAGRRRRHWPWTLALQAVLTYASYPFVGAVSLPLAAFLAGSCLLLLPARLRWVAFGLVVFSIPVLLTVAPILPVAARETLLWAVYASVINAAWGLMVYGLSRLTSVVTELVEARAELAELATVREQLRITRDTHDLLGLGLSAIALKTDIAAELVARDPAGARREIGEILRLASTTRDDARAVSSGPPRPTLATELRTTGEILRSAGIEVCGCPEPRPMPTDVDAALAIVLREAVTNVLRHSTATRVEVEVAASADEAALTVRNDGAFAPDGPTGQGLPNLRARLGTLDGTLRWERVDGRFVLAAAVPLTATTTTATGRVR